MPVYVVTKDLQVFSVLVKYKHFHVVYFMQKFSKSLHTVDQIKKTEMGKTCSMYEGVEMFIQGFGGEN
jgi:hypothetical protein